MGNSCCKPDRKSGGKDTVETELNVRTVDDVVEGEINEETIRNQQELDYWTDQLHNDLPMFVINNVLMATQFFRNPEEELEILRKEACEDMELGEHRLKHFQADKLMDHVGLGVVHRPKHGPFKNTESFLHPLRSFILYQNVQVLEQDVRKLGEKLTPPHYKLLVEPAQDDNQERAGYMNLKELETQEEEGIYESIGTPRRTTPQTSEPIEEDSDGEREKMIQSMRLSLMKVSKKQVEEEEVYPYTTIQKLTEKMSVFQAQRGGSAPADSCSIPRDAFSKVEIPNLLAMRRTGRSEPKNTTVNYLSSVKFSSNFIRVLTDRLAETLNIGTILDTAPVQAGRVLIDFGKASHQIMPAVPVPFWPDCAQHFLDFESDKRKDVWPNRRMKKKIKNMGMFARPLGFLQKKGLNPAFDLQWRYVCPKGEQYLLLNTMHAHIRCYLFTIAIFKSFLNPDATFLGLSHTHILHLLFAQIHKNFYDWPEDKPAVSLVAFLKELYDATEKKKINNFFIKGRNMLESSPLMFLNKTQSVLARLSENPLPYILLAIKNLRTKHYPELDVSYIYKLVVTNDILGFLNPKLNTQEKEHDSTEMEDLDAYDIETQKHMWMEWKHKQEKKEKAQQLETSKGSLESIDVEAIPENYKDAVQDRRWALLEELIPHFIEMGKKCREYKASAQSKMYFDHAKRLTELFAREGADGKDVDKHRHAIVKAEKVENRNSRREETYEELPVPGVRLSSQFRDLPKPPEEDQQPI